MTLIKRIRSTGTVLSFVIGIVACSGASGPPAQSRAEQNPPGEQLLEVEQVTPTPEDSPKAFIWKAQSTTTPETVFYLLGSIHVAKADFYPLDPVIEDAFNSSDTLVVEVDLSSISEAQALRVVMEKAILPKGETLEQRLSPETWAKMVTILTELKFAPAKLKRLKPWFAAVTIVALRVAEEGYSPEYGIDQYFMKKGEKEIIELETPESQLALFDDIDGRLEELLVIDAIQGSLQSGGDLEQVMRAWQNGDTAALNDLMFGSLSAQPEFEPIVERLFNARNRKMADRLEELLKSHNSLFVVVGAGHLVGEQGLVEILRRRGYTLIQQKKTGNATRVAGSKK